jgi:UTP--glucose-1-phosphate uridylyltransferase
LSVKKAIIPAAGYGTRFLPMTKATAKEMLNIVDKPAIQYIVEEAVASGIEDILIITTRNRSAIVDHFDASPELEAFLEAKGNEDMLDLVRDVSGLANIHYIRQQASKGLGHAILQAKTFVGDEPFAVMLADDLIDSQQPCLQQLIQVHEEINASVLGVQNVAMEAISKYGIVEGRQVDDNLFEVQSLVEKPQVSSSNMAMLGRYVLSPSIFRILGSLEPGLNDEIQLTDALIELADKEPMFAYDFEGTRYDTGDKLGYLKAVVAYALKHTQVKDDFAEYIKVISELL